jgi:cellobiose transport system permease protein
MASSTLTVDRGHPTRRGGWRRSGASRAGGQLRAGPLTYLVLIVVAVISLFPVYWALVGATRSNSEINAPTPPLLPGGNFLHNLSVAMQQEDLWAALRNSIIVSGVVTVCVVFFTTLAGFAFAKLRFRFRGLLLGLVIATLMIPPQLGVIPLYLFMARLHWTDQLSAVILPNVVTAFGVFFMRQYLVEALPNELIEAGRMDGASTLRIFRSVVLPVARPAMVALALLTFITSWNDFLWPLIALKDNPTMQVALNGLGQGYVHDQSVIMAGTVFSLIPVIVIFLALGRQIVGGVLQGAVKG